MILDRHGDSLCEGWRMEWVLFGAIQRSRWLHSHLSRWIRGSGSHRTNVCITCCIMLRSLVILNVLRSFPRLPYLADVIDTDDWSCPASPSLVAKRMEVERKRNRVFGSGRLPKKLSQALPTCIPSHHRNIFIHTFLHASSPPPTCRYLPPIKRAPFLLPKADFDQPRCFQQG